MKKIIIALLLPMAMSAQTNWLEQNMNLQEADSNHIKAMVSGKAFELMSYAKPDSILTDEIMQMARSVKGMMGYMELSGATIDAAFTAMEGNSAFEEYARMTRKDEKLGLYVKQTDGVVNEAVMLVKSDDQNMAMSIFGNMDMRAFGELYKLVPYGDMRRLQHKHDHNGDHDHDHAH